MVKPFVVIAAVSGLLAVVLGAFAAHGLKGKIEAPLLAAFQTGVHYQFYHTLALLLLALVSLHLPQSGALYWSGWAFIAGIVLFSGSLYGLALGGPSWLGPITPLGGLSFILGWLLLLLGSWRLTDV